MDKVKLFLQLMRDGGPVMRIRSLEVMRWGDEKNPVRYPVFLSMASSMAPVDPLPLEPARWMKRIFRSSGLPTPTPQYSASRVTFSKPSLMPEARSSSRYASVPLKSVVRISGPDHFSRGDQAGIRSFPEIGMRRYSPVQVSTIISAAFLPSRRLHTT